MMDVRAATQAAQSFEASTLGALLAPMFDTVPTGPFDGGAAEQAWRPLMVQEMAKQIASHGGVGLAQPVLRQMLAMQGAGAMSPAERLADALRRENAALERHDLPAAAALLAAKQSAAQAFAAAVEQGAPAAWAEPMRELAGLAEANRRLLERAIEVQRRVIGLVARQASAGGANRYDRRGAQVSGGVALGAWAHLSRA